MIVASDSSMDASTPIPFWIGFHVLLLVLLGAELLYARRRVNRPPQGNAASEHRTAVVATILWISAAVLFALLILTVFGGHSAVEYISGYAIEESLSVDNLFVFLLLFRIFRIEAAGQPRVLFWGVAGAIVMRGLFIAAGLTLLEHFEWISYIFGAVLLIASVRLVLPQDKQTPDETPRWLRWLARIHPVSLQQDRFFAVENGQRMATVLTLALVAIELTDIVFAFDSIPAVLSVTRHPFLAYTSNIMAVMGLRSLFFLLAHLLEQLRYLHFGLAGVLAFAAFKMLAEHWIAVGPLLSLGVIVAILGITIGFSLAGRAHPAKAR